MNVGPLNFAAGQIPGLPVFSFTADESLIERALASAKEVAPQLQVISGRVASGDHVCKFIRSCRPHLHNVWC